MSTDTSDVEQDQAEAAAGQIQPFLRGQFALYWSADGNDNVHLRVRVDGMPSFDQDLPFAMVKRFLPVDSPAGLMDALDEMRELAEAEAAEAEEQAA